LFYSGLFFLVSYLGNDFDYLDSVFFAVGIFFGIVLMRLDEVLLFKYYLEPKDYLEAKAKKTRSRLEPSSKPIFFGEFGQSSKKINLITRSLLFIFSLFPLGLFIITSTGSELGIGMFLGIITTLLLELIKYRKNEDSFHARFLFQLKRKLSTKEINFFVASFGILTLIFALLTFFLGR